MTNLNINQEETSKEETIQANIYVHSFLAKSGEYNKSPHFRPENQDKVRKILLRLSSECKQRKRAIDFGCGTGFMIHLMRDLFEEVHGVDVTKEMMSHVDLSSGNVTLHESVAENTSFADEMFDFATAYSFMDHLADYHAFLREAHRVLKKGGVFYSDLNPNRDFVSGIARVEERGCSLLSITEVVNREIQGALHNGEYYATKYGVDAKLLEKAEPLKTINKGFDAIEVLKVASDIGFEKFNVEFEWFIGQGKVIHQQSTLDAELIEQYLKSVLPISSNLFKYLRFIFVK